jgi:hypothetical protein
VVLSPVDAAGRLRGTEEGEEGAEDIALQPALEKGSKNGSVGDLGRADLAGWL